MKQNSLIIMLLASLTLLSCNSPKKEQKLVEKETSPPSLSNQVVDVFEEKFGVHEGKRRNHIDGFCFSGVFTIKDQRIKQYTKSKMFDDTPLRVLGRFSHKGGVKNNESDLGEYGMAFEVQLENGGIHNFSMNTLDFFPVNSPEGFLQLMQAKVSGKDEDFAKLKVDHPEFATYKSHYGSKPKQPLRSYANHQFNSVNSFLLEDEQGNLTPIRWSFIPRNRDIEIDASHEVDFFKETEKALSREGSLVWDMVITIANEDDKINDASVMWQGEHKQIVAATLTISEIVASGECDDKNFDPLRLQSGFRPSDDPILKFRSPAYASSFSRRIQEKNK